MVPPMLGTYGTMGRNIFRDSAFKDVDFSIFKNFKIKERFNAQLRLETFNTLNHPIYANRFAVAVQLPQRRNPRKQVSRKV